MKWEFPNDADGDALRRFVKEGSDLTKPMRIDFQVGMPDEAAAKKLAQIVSRLGYKVGIYRVGNAVSPGHANVLRECWLLTTALLQFRMNWPNLLHR